MNKNHKINIFLGILSICLLASSNYVINEWLDAEFDKFHPEKKTDHPQITRLLE